MDKGVETLKPFHTVCKNGRWCIPSGKGYGGFLKIKLPYDPTIPLLRTYPEELKLGSWSDINTPMLTSALLIKATYNILFIGHSGKVKTTEIKNRSLFSGVNSGGSDWLQGAIQGDFLRGQDSCCVLGWHWVSRFSAFTKTVEMNSTM